MIDPDALTGRVERFVGSRQLLLPGPLLVAVSGGQDSVCMLDILRRIAAGLELNLVVAHLNHHFRGAQAAEEAEFVRSLAAEWGLPAEVGAIDVSAYRARHRLSKQVAARYARYQFLARTAGRLGATQVAVGHTADDAAETVLLNLLRGAGLTGLGGPAPKRQLVQGQLGPALDARDWRSPELRSTQGPLPAVVRPILHLSRAETEAYCRSCGLPFRSDPSNLDTRYRRNWLRGELIPMMERRVPGATKRLSDTADLLSDDLAIVRDVVDRRWNETAKVNDAGVEIDLTLWKTMDEPLQRYLLRRAVEEVAGSLDEIGRVHLDSSLQLVRKGVVGSRLDLPGGIYIERGYNSFLLTRRGTPPEALPFPKDGIEVQVPGKTRIAPGVVEAEIVLPAEETGDLKRSPDPSEAHLDADRVGPDLVLRGRKPGDRFVPLGMTGPKKLQDFLVDQKVPRGERDRVPIVATPNAIVWIVGHRIDDRFKVTGETKRVLVLKYRG